MRILSSQYINELVSLTVMALMILALVSGQGFAGTPASDAAIPVPAGTVVSLEFSFRHDGE